MRFASRSIVAAACVLLLVAPSTRAQHDPLAPDQDRATSEIRAYFRAVTDRVAHRALESVDSLDDWQQLRPVLREQILEMLGLAPLPARTDLHATVTGTEEFDDIVVEKLHFQSRPGLYVTANFYRPKQVDKPLPTILYLCGHGNVKLEGVSYGSKTNYQHHPAWFARQGYCCLILDTLQLGEIEGLHHGTHREGMWWWWARGYTPAGVEAWNAVRALDYLESRPEVDAKRIGVTGRSGGGAYTWWIAAIDDRPACLVPVAGVTDMQNHVVDDCIEGHCDCMFMVNTYAWDFSTLAALAAPRPLLLSNTDKDRIFPLDGVVRTHAQVKKIYDLHAAADKLGLLITEGPHKDTQELQVPAFRWMNRWLQAKDEPITRVADKPFDPKRLKVFSELPPDQRNTSIHESFVPPAAVPPAATSRTEWESLRSRWIGELKDKSFRHWPAAPPAVQPNRLLTKAAHGLVLEITEFTSDVSLTADLWLIRSANQRGVSRILLTVLDQASWSETVPQVRAVFGIPEASSSNAAPADPAESAASWSRDLEVAHAFVVPRGVGRHQWTSDKKKDTHIQRRFALLGETADSGRVWDTLRAAELLGTRSEFKNSKITVTGRGGAAGLALYAALFSPSVDVVRLVDPPASHRAGPYYLNVLRVLDLPQAAAMVFPRRLEIETTNPSAWEWTESIAKLYDAPLLLTH